MSGYSFTPTAEQDVQEICDYIGKTAADKWAARLEDICDSFVKFPKLGVQRPKLGEDVRALAMGEYVVYYRRVKRHIQILRVLNAARDLDRNYWENLRGEP